MRSKRHPQTLSIHLGPRDPPLSLTKHDQHAGPLLATILSLRRTMLRRRLSAGALRAQAQLHTQTPPPAPRNTAGVTASAAAAKATISPREQSKSLGSVVLLNTQRHWKGETVVTLKAELKKRGLSQTGNKATLISRLESADTTGLAPPVPPVSRVLRAEAKARAQRSRAYATPSAPARVAVPVARDDVVKPVITTSDLPVNAPAAEVPVSEPTAAEKTSAPGLPVRKPMASDAFTIYFPDPKPEREPPQVIPTLPHTITSTATRPLPDDVDEDFGLPKVVTVASAATHPDGGPVHGTTKVSDDGSAVASDGMVGDDITAQVISKAQEQIQAAKEATSEILELSGIPVENPIKLPEEEGATYKANSKPLSAEERSGAWILAGLVGGVVLLGSLGGKAKAKAKETKADK
ncbi:hypothetical protein CC85DRAFT_285957 [Cutaneotrichosporon oleaginosum]|uniref:SAP domain-containing protein n=1 Tax=Cutaneotrichosporon oleaginosum TaxID=879819 RepID=A0A0J0XLQ5_9TREE|nr:uncharacterized protein CC85DRAFT_285957 [Cutaneotrichosporon oleaginosum]KLT42027.1 hypothetical protein CC85DRAFT_285957 [Cutaneotrichosporon oleaginosum]TXT14317.1 hypothetical protein COLE_00510 [Cutaneotrichosporon oleaginosum]